LKHHYPTPKRHPPTPCKKPLPFSLFKSQPSKPYDNRNETWPCHPKRSSPKRHPTSGATCRRRSTMHRKEWPIPSHTLKRRMGRSSRRVFSRWIKRSKPRCIWPTATDLILAGCFRRFASTLLPGVMLFLLLIFLGMADQTVYAATWVINSLSSSLINC